MRGSVFPNYALKTITLANGKVALVDDKDFDRLNRAKWNEYKNASGIHYARRALGGPPPRHTEYMHRVVLNAPAGMEVDHINGNGLDNRRANLRLCTHAENGKNKGKSRNSTSKYLGVSWRNDRQCWRAQICSKGRKTSFGSFQDEKEAAKCRDAHALAIFGKFARLNFPLSSHD